MVIDTVAMSCIAPIGGGQSLACADMYIALMQMAHMHIAQMHIAQMRVAEPTL